MGMVKLPNLALYWSTDEFFAKQGIKKTIIKNRFEEISCYLYFSNSSKEPTCGDANYNRLYKVRSIPDYVRLKCQGNFKPTKNISVDEGMVGFRGRLSFRQLSPLSRELKFG